MSGDEARFLRYRELQKYVGWAEEDVERVKAAGPLIEPFFSDLIDDFYDEILRHPDAARVIVGGDAQIRALKESLRRWIAELYSGVYDQPYVDRRIRVGRKHAQIGLAQVFTIAALARLRRGMIQILEYRWPPKGDGLAATRRSVDMLLDLDLALIDEAYQVEALEKERRDERFATLGKAAGGIAHELRHPLNVLKTSVYFLRNAPSISLEKISEHLDRIERQVDVADRVVRALSDFARMPQPILTQVPLPECLREAIELEPRPEHVLVHTQFPDVLPPALADGDQLRIVFSNLIRNAIEAMPKGGTLSVSIALCGHRLEAVIADTGTGIPHDILLSIHEPFVTTKPRGMGLGLAIARSILDNHQGEMVVTSKPGEGTTVTVRIPAAIGVP